MLSTTGLVSASESVTAERDAAEGPFLPSSSSLCDWNARLFGSSQKCREECVFIFDCCALKTHFKATLVLHSLSCETLNHEIKIDYLELASFEKLMWRHWRVLNLEQFIFRLCVWGADSAACLTRLCVFSQLSKPFEIFSLKPVVWFDLKVVPPTGSLLR